jgi:voltage-gated potassium channel
MQQLDRHLYRYLSALVAIVLAGGTVFYHFVEKFSWINSWYFCVVTLATVGYGDIVPKTDIGKLFTSFYIIVGVGIITTFLSASIRRRGLAVRERLSNKLGPPSPNNSEASDQ